MQQSSTNPFFSVIIPVFNVKDYLCECIDSILRQSISDYEILLIDDGSKDGSELICDMYCQEHKNIRVIHKENGGQSSARNLGVREICGEYFIFVDSDDFIAPNTLELFKAKIKKYGELDVILSECMYNVDPDGSIIDNQVHMVASEFDGITGQHAILQMGMEWSPCGKCYRTGYWRRNKFEFIEGRISEDFQLIDRVTLGAEKVAMVPAHYYYRWKIQSSTMHANYGKLVNDTVFAIADWKEYLNKCMLDSGVVDTIRKTLAKMLEHTAMGNVFYAEKENRDSLITEISKVCDLIEYDKTTEGRIIYLSINVIGIKNTCYILNRFKTHRKKTQSFV